MSIVCTGNDHPSGRRFTKGKVYPIKAIKLGRTSIKDDAGKTVLIPMRKGYGQYRIGASAPSGGVPYFAHFKKSV